MRWAGLALLAACGGHGADAPPHVRLTIAWPDRPAAEVASAVAAPLEQQLVGRPGIAHVHSWSRADRTELDIELAPGSSRDPAMQAIVKLIGEAQLPPSLPVRPRPEYVDPRAKVAWVAGDELFAVAQKLEQTEGVERVDVCGAGKDPPVVVEIEPGGNLAAQAAHAVQDGMTTPLPPPCQLAMTFPGAQVARVRFTGELAALRARVADVDRILGGNAHLVMDAPSEHLTAQIVTDEISVAGAIGELRHAMPEASAIVRAHDGIVEIDAWNAPRLEDLILLSLSGAQEWMSPALAPRVFTGADAVAAATAEGARQPEHACPACVEVAARRISIDRDAAARLGLSDEDLAQALALARGPIPVSPGVSARLAHDADPSQILVGARVPLAAVATWTMAREPLVVEHVDGQPAATLWTKLAR
ncbi:MAG TPA: hypothetical protein VGM88_04055 [Kofleriaceae bacterium]|jgi:hypothetical protein